MRTTTRCRRAAVVMAAGLTLAACGGGAGDEPSSGVASLAETGEPVAGDDGTTPDAGGEVAGEPAVESDREAPEDPELAFALYDECMSAAGFDFGSSLGGEDGEGIAIEEVEVPAGADPQQGGLDDFDFSADFDAADEDCSGHLANLDIDFDLSPEEEAALEDAQIAWAACMREQGIEVPDFDGGEGVAIVIGPEAEDSDPQSGGVDELDFEAFEEANEQCAGVFDEMLGDAGVEFGEEAP